MKYFWAIALLAFVIYINGESTPETPNACDKPCTHEFKPICGTNGTNEVQFSNTCVMEVANCMNRVHNATEFKDAGRQFCKEEDKPTSWNENSTSSSTVKAE